MGQVTGIWITSKEIKGFKDQEMTNNDLKGGEKIDEKGRLQENSLQLFDNSIQKRQAVRK